MMAIPGPGETLALPPPAEWIGVARINAAGLAQLDPLRTAMRNAALHAARVYTARLGLPVSDLPADVPLIMAGHQPHFFHPGVLYKYRLLTDAAAQGMAALHLEVDTEPCDGFMCNLPVYGDGEYRRVAHYLLPSAAALLYADAVAGEKEIGGFVDNAVRDLRSLPEPLFESGVAFLEREVRPLRYTMMVDAMVSWRRAYTAAWPQGVLEVPLSELCRTGPYFAFAFDLLRRAPVVAAIFNEELNAYRREHKLRSKANPFPDLEIKGEAVESLFWITAEKMRLPLFVKTRNGALSLLLDKEMPVADAAALEALCAERGLRLWPRAVALSMLNRLFIADMFVHGVGGAKYDRITDRLIERLYGVTPPVLAVASASPVPEGLADPSAELAALKQELRESSFHPERHLADPPAGLLAEKKELLEAIKAPGADKKSIGARISAINDELNRMLEPVRREMEARITEAEARLVRHATLAHREHPYFLFPADRQPGVRAAVDFGAEIP